jgi:hypothetical protein
MAKFAWFLVTLFAVAPRAVMAENRSLANAEQLFNELRYREAVRALDGAVASEGNDRKTLVRILEMQGICAALLSHAARAATFFEATLFLEPDHVLKGDWPPRVTTPFFEAKAWVADHGSLVFEAAPVTSDAAVRSLTVSIPRDPLHMVRRVRFHRREDGGSWVEQVTDAHAGTASSSSVSGHRIEWWAELLGDHAAVLSAIGSTGKPLEAIGPKSGPAITGVPASPPPTAAAANPPPSSAPVSVEPPRPAAQPMPTPVAQAEIPDAGSPGNAPPFRVPAYAGLGTGVVVTAIGIVIGARSAQESSTLTNVTTNAQGRVTSLTQRQAYALDQSRRNNAIIGNTLMGVGVGLVLVGAGLWFYGGHLALAATPQGVAVEAPLP